MSFVVREDPQLQRALRITNAQPQKRIFEQSIKFFLDSMPEIIS